MSEKAIIAFVALLVLALVVLSLQLESSRLTRLLGEAKELHARDRQETRALLEKSLAEIDELRLERERLQRELDESAAFISKLRAEAFAAALKETKR